MSSAPLVPPLLEIDEALALVLGRVVPLGAEAVPLAEAAGRFTAEDVAAQINLPPFRASAMDGFAIRAADAPGALTLGERISTGRPALRPLGIGEAFPISTGGVVPEGADSVVPIEEASDADGVLTIPGGVRPGASVRAPGSDLALGAVVVAAGTRLGPVHLGALAAAGLATVSCRQRPRVAIVVTGSELRPPGSPLADGEIYDANGILLTAQVAGAGGLPAAFGAVPDDAEATTAALARGLEADVLLTSGGVSVGVHDLVRDVGATLGVEEVFWGVSVRPGKPLAFGVRGSALVFGLPGNPVSSLVSFELFVRPALLALQGAASPRPRFLPGRLGSPVAGGRERDWLLRARRRVEGDAVVLDVLSGQESHMVARAATADALVLVAKGDRPLEPGASVSFLEL